MRSSNFWEKPLFSSALQKMADAKKRSCNHRTKIFSKPSIRTLEETSRLSCLSIFGLLSVAATKGVYLYHWPWSSGIHGDSSLALSTHSSIQIVLPWTLHDYMLIHLGLAECIFWDSVRHCSWNTFYRLHNEAVFQHFNIIMGAFDFWSVRLTNVAISPQMSCSIWFVKARKPEFRTLVETVTWGLFFGLISVWTQSKIPLASMGNEKVRIYMVGLAFGAKR